MLWVGLPGMADEIHPLQAAIDFCESAHQAVVRGIMDYQAVLVKRERVQGQLRDPEVLHIRIRHAREVKDGPPLPFSVYIQFQYPESTRGREVVYVAGRHDDQLLVRGPSRGLVGRLVPRLTLDPRGSLAMQGNRYPVTEIGFEVLLKRVLAVAREEMKLADCQVQFRKDARVNDRRCTVVEVTHPRRDQRFKYYRCRIYIDDELKCPIRFESYDWPGKPGMDPPLLEEYTYLEVKTNQGMTDADFRLTK